MKPFNITAKEFLDAHKVNRGVMSQLLIPAVCLFTFFIVGGNKLLFTEGELNPIGVVSLCMILCSLLIARILAKRTLLKSFNSHKVMQEEVAIDFDTDHVHWESESGSCTLKWEDIHCVKSGKGLMLVYETKQLMRIVPERAFESEQERQEFIKYFEKNR